MLHFVDRKKNIIRRSGENIAAAEIEALLQAHAAVKQVAVLAVPDEMREEEVLACVVLHDDQRDAQAAADTLFEHCYAQLAYFKAPGWIYFTRRAADHRHAEDPEAPDLPRRHRSAHAARHVRPARAQETLIALDGGTSSWGAMGHPAGEPHCGRTSSPVGVQRDGSWTAACAAVTKSGAFSCAR